MPRSKSYKVRIGVSSINNNLFPQMSHRSLIHRKSHWGEQNRQLTPDVSVSDTTAESVQTQQQSLCLTQQQSLCQTQQQSLCQTQQQSLWQTQQQSLCQTQQQSLCQTQQQSLCQTQQQSVSDTTAESVSGTTAASVTDTTAESVSDTTAVLCQTQQQSLRQTQQQFCVRHNRRVCVRHNSSSVSDTTAESASPVVTSSVMQSPRRSGRDVRRPCNLDEYVCKEQNTQHLDNYEQSTPLLTKTRWIKVANASAPMNSIARQCETFQF